MFFLVGSILVRFSVIEGNKMNVTTDVRGRGGDICDICN